MVCAATPAQYEWGRLSRGRLRPAPRVLCRRDRTNQDSADRMSGQCLFYHEAIHCNKCRDSEPPCWNVPGWRRHCDESAHRNSARKNGQYDATIACGSCIDYVTVTHLFSFEIESGPTRNKLYDCRLSKVTWRFEIQMDTGFLQYHQRLNSRPWLRKCL